MGYEAKVLADSIFAHGTRLITVQATFPRFILAEVNTHRVFSRNSASSRAIPPDDKIEDGKVVKKGLLTRVMEEPFIPETFNARVKGMGVGAALEANDVAACEDAWLDARDFAVRQARILVERNVDKSRVNRLLEPFMWHTAIISSTEWENFFALRCPPGDEATPDFPAQLEFQKVALLMRECMRASKPKQIGHTGSAADQYWHLPLVTAEDIKVAREGKFQDPTWESWKWLAMVSAGRCARVSFDTQDDYESAATSHSRALKLMENGHLSPFEHPARPERVGTEAAGNFRQWVQLRQLIPHERNRVGHLQKRRPWFEETP